MGQTQAQKVRQLLDKKGLNPDVKQSIKDKSKVLETNQTINK